MQQFYVKKESPGLHSYFADTVGGILNEQAGIIILPAFSVIVRPVMEFGVLPKLIASNGILRMFSL